MNPEQFPTYKSLPSVLKTPTTADSMPGLTDKPLHILIIEAYTDANVGSCALVENSIKILRSRFVNPDIQIMAQYPRAFTDLYGLPGIQDIFLYPSKQPRLKQIWWLSKTLIWMLSTLFFVLVFPQKKISSLLMLGVFAKIQPFLWADIIVSVGAERLNDKYYKSGPFSLYVLMIGKLLKKKVIIFPSTIGPFFFGWSKLLTGKVLPRLDAVYTRDQASSEVLHNVLKVPHNKVIRSVDVAVLQESVTKEEAYRLIGVAQNEALVGISVLKWGYFKNSVETAYSNYPAYVREMASLADTLIEKYHITVVFYPTNYQIHACEDDDLATVYDILPLIKNRNKVRVISELPTPSQLQGMLSRSEINITTRMHACILSTNSYTPTISINYLFKLKEYMASLGLADFSVDIEEFSTERVLSAFQRMWLEKEKWRKHLEAKIRERCETLWQSMETLNDIIR
jgi:polysaccharide pyruvyl transferase WcaK-like protein